MSIEVFTREVLNRVSAPVEVRHVAMQVAPENISKDFAKYRPTFLGMERNWALKNLALTATIIALIVLSIIAYLFFPALAAGTLTLNSIITYGVSAGTACVTVVSGYLYYLNFKESENRTGNQRPVGALG